MARHVRSIAIHEAVALTEESLKNNNARSAYVISDHLGMFHVTLDLNIKGKMLCLTYMEDGGRLRILRWRT
jgi:hypothetical protein